jgi:hypothetical protein
LYRAFNTSYVSTDKIFEVDGADASREHLHKEGQKWDDHRIQTVWDAIALHTSPDIAIYKQTEVAIVSIGTYTELVGISLSKAIFVRYPVFFSLFLLPSNVVNG